MAQITLDKVAHSYMAHPQDESDYALRLIDNVWDDGGAYALLGPSGSVLMPNKKFRWVEDWSEAMWRLSCLMNPSQS